MFLFGLLNISFPQHYHSKKPSATGWEVIGYEVCHGKCKTA